MQINTNNYSVLELMNMLERRELNVDKEYQRGSGLWPQGPSSYFIDTILEGYPFPKLYFYENLDRPNLNLRKDIVDGQQRINTIQRFYSNKLVLNSDSRFVGLSFETLEPELQQAFLSYVVSVDIIRNADKAEILQMFRRMNAYTLPLNEAEKRHSSFQGLFKWFVNGVSDDLNEFFVEYGVFTTREIVRMADAELIAECVYALEHGVVSSSAARLTGLYEEYDERFVDMNDIRMKLSQAFEFIYTRLSGLRGTYMMKPYALHSLVTALLHCRFGIGKITDDWGVDPLGVFATSPEDAEAALIALAQAHEAKEIDGPFGTYVWGAAGGTNRAPRRTARVCAVLRALGAVVPAEVDANLA
jgi:hypothetical protein